MNPTCLLLPPWRGIRSGPARRQTCWTGPGPRPVVEGLLAAGGVLHFTDEFLDDVLEKEHPGGLTLGGE